MLSRIYCAKSIYIIRVSKCWIWIEFTISEMGDVNRHSHLPMHSLPEFAHRAKTESEKIAKLTELLNRHKIQHCFKWKSIKIHRNPWESQEIHENRWKSVKINRKSLKIKLFNKSTSFLTKKKRRGRQTHLDTCFSHESARESSSEAENLCMLIKIALPIQWSNPIDLETLKNQIFQHPTVQEVGGRAAAPKYVRMQAYLCM